MRFHYLFVLALSSLSLTTTCDSFRSGPPASESVSAKPILVVLKPIEAVLIEKGKEVVNVVESKIDVKEEFRAAQFVDSDYGWASTNKILYKTSDGGKSWERLTFSLSEDSRVSSFFFIDRVHGWVAVVTEADVDRNGFGNSSHIMVSSDGGKSWLEQGSFPGEVKLSHIKFLNANEGLTTGAKVINQKPSYDEIFVARTSDGGIHWTDISEKVKPAISNELGFANGFGRDILWLSSSRILLLLSDVGRIITSPDGGETWKTVVQFKDERPNGLLSSIGYQKVTVDTHGEMRVIAGGMGEEGYWGDLVVEATHSWTSFELLRTPILDAVFLSDNGVVACGQQIQVYDEKTKTRQPSVGIVLHSPDMGKSWTPIYRSKSSETFISLTKVGDNQFYTVSDTGTFLRFALKSD